MCIKVIHNKPDFDCIRVVDLKQFPHLLRPLSTRSSFCYTDASPASQRLDKKKNIRYAASNIFVVVAQRAPWLARDWSSDFAHQLLARFIHAHLRIQRVIWKLIDTKNILHICHKGRALLWRNLPAFLQVRLKFVFFSAFCTDDFDMCSNISSCTNRSASNRTVHRFRPSGGGEQASAISRASFSPSKIDSRGGLSRGLRSSAALIPSSTNRRLVFSTVRVVTPRASAIRALGHAGPREPASQSSKVRACINFLAPVLFVFVSLSSSSRSVLLSSTLYRTAMATSLSGSCQYHSTPRLFYE